MYFLLYSDQDLKCDECVLLVKYYLIRTFRFLRFDVEAF